MFIATLSLSQGSEADYSRIIQKHLGGEMEVHVFAGRADLVTETHAYEIEFAPNWKEAIGQALWYGLQTNKKPGIVIIMKHQKEFTYVQQLVSALDYAELTDKIDVHVYPLDFE